MAQELGDLVVSLGLDSAGFEAGINSLNRTMKVVQSEFQASTAKLGDFAKGTDGLKLKAEALSKQIDIQKIKVDTLKKAFDESVEAKGADARETQKLETRLNTAQAALSNLENQLIKVNENIEKQSSGWYKFSEALKPVGESLKKIGKDVSDAGEKLSKTLTAPIIGAGTAAAKFAMDFGDSIAQLMTIADSAQVPVEGLKKGIVDLSNQTGMAAIDVTEAVYEAVSSGVETANAVQFVEAATKAAKGGFTDTLTAVDGLTTVLNAYGLEASKVTDISDQMMVAQNYGKTTFGEMAGSLGQVIPIAASLNVSTEELFASLAELTNSGIGTSQAITGLKAAYSNVVKPSVQASKMAQQLGIDFSSAHLQSVGWAAFLDEVKEKTGGSSEKMAQLFGSVEALNTVLVLTGKGSEGFKDALGQMYTSAGLAEQAFQKVSDTSGEALNRALNSLKNSAMEIGEVLLPFVDRVSQFISSISEKLHSLTPQQQESLVAVLAVTAAIGPLLVGIGKLISAVGGIMSALSAVSAAIAEAGGLLAVLSNPVTIVIASIAALIAAFVILWNTCEEFRNGVKSLWDDISAWAASIGAVFTASFQYAADAFVPVMERISGIGERLLPAFQSIWNTLQPIFMDLAIQLGFVFTVTVGVINGILYALAPLADAVVYAIEFIINIIGSLCAFLQGDFAGAWELLQQSMGNLLGVVVSVFDAVWQFLIGFWEGISGVFHSFGIDLTAYLNGLWNGIKDFCISIWNSIADFLTGLWQSISIGVQSAWHGINNFLSSIWDAIKNMASTIWNAVMNIIISAVTPIVKWFSDTWESIKDSTETVFNGIKDYFAGIWEVIKNIFLGALLLLCDLITGNFTQMKSDAERIWSNIKDGFTQIWEGIKQIFTGALNIIMKISINTWNTLKDTIVKVWTDIQNFFSELWVSIKNTASSAWEGFKITVSTIVLETAAFVTDIWNSVLAFFSELPNKLYNYASDMFIKMKEGVTATVTHVKDAVVYGITAAIDWIKALPSQAFTWGKDMIMGMVNGIKSCIGVITDAVTGVAEKIRSFLHFSVPDEGPLADYETWMPDFMSELAEGIKSNRFKVINAISELSKEMNIQPVGVMTEGAYNRSNRAGGDIIQHISIHSPKHMLPSEVVRKSKQAARELALEWGL